MQNPLIDPRVNELYARVEARWRQMIPEVIPNEDELALALRNIRSLLGEDFNLIRQRAAALGTIGEILEGNTDATES